MPPSTSDALLSPLPVGQCFTLATIMECTAHKPGNIHRGADFEDTSYPDFLIAATVVGPIMEEAIELPLGQTVLSAIKASQASVATNTNLGTVLLVAPMAKVPRTTSLEQGIGDVLGKLTPQDARDVYLAIRLARPGGLGKVESADVAGEPPEDLTAAMRLAADHDMVARQYARNFEDIFTAVVPCLVRALDAGMLLADAIVHVYLELLREYPDSLVARRRGLDVAKQASAMAARVLESGYPGQEDYQRALADLDFWLRADGHARNPGTTADLVAAGLFVALRDEIIKPPFRLVHPT